MTIGIGAYGREAGQAVFEALRAAEAIGTGALGGFAVFAAIGEDNSLHIHQTQRGGSRTLFVEGETTGVPPPGPVASARAAAVISSGPDRPEPLSQFLAADPAAGIVTGHRLPNGPGASGRPLNVEALEALRAGRTAREAVDAAIAASPESDAGLIAVDTRGGVHARNSERVLRRPDLGQAHREDPALGACVEVLHNAILPGPAVAAIAAETALQVMRGKPCADGWVTVPAGIPLRLGDENAVFCNADGLATHVMTTDPVIVRGHQVGAAVYLASRVYRSDGSDSGDEYLGVTMFEPIVTVEDGVIVALSGQREIRISYRDATGP